MVGEACQEGSQAPEQGLTFERIGHLHCNQERETIEGGVLLRDQARLWLLLITWDSTLGSPS